MAGIGPVTTNRSDLLRRAGARPGISNPQNELEIFCSLCVGRVYYRSANRTLYFVDSPALSISELIRGVFRGLRQVPRFGQLYMDEHNLFRAASFVQLSKPQRQAVFAALALSGIRVTR